MKKQTKTIGDQRKKQVEALKVLKPDTQQLSVKNKIPDDQLSEEVKNEIEETKEIENMVNRETLFYKGKKDKCNF